MAYSKVVDADGHILEPRDLWQNYLEAKYQARGVRFRFNDRGEEFIEVDGKPFFGRAASSSRDDGRQPGGRLGALGGIGGYPDMDRAKQTARRPFNYMDGAPPGAMDPHERIEVLDKEGIDVALLYPTIGIIWEEAVADPGLAAALCRAYNNWLVDFCKPYPERLFPVAHIPLHDVGDAVVEMKRTAKLGVRGFFLRPDITDNRTLGHADLDPIWATAQEMGIPVAPHVVCRRVNHP
ncbi:MAG: amidohydrolase family protein, partial [Chloroflexi bacterium]|nr:amidohydrolase family protein [Chloroflexota bacterium]